MTEIKLPSDVEIEQALLGCALVDALVLDDAASICEVEDFSDPMHQRLWSAMLKMRSQGVNVTPFTVFAECSEDAGLAQVGGAAYLKSLARSASAAPNVQDYARILRTLSLRRHLMTLGQTAIENAAQSLSVSPISEQIAQIEEGLTWILDRSDSAPKACEAGDAAMSALQAAEDARHKSRGLGAPTGIRELNSMFGGLYPGDLVIVAGRPAMGKSTLATTFARASAQAEFTVEFFSLEMSERDLSLRLACDIEYDRRGHNYPLSYSRLARGKAGAVETERAWSAARELRGLPIRIYDRDSMTMPEIASLAKARAARSKKPGVIIIDHLQIVSVLDRYRGNRVQELTEMTKQAKGLAKRLNWPVVLLSQLSRDAEKRGEKERRPMLSDLRDSGSIEQDADIVIGMYRPAYYLEQTRPELMRKDPRWTEWEVAYREKEHDLELLILKNRHGETGKVNVHCDMRSASIRDFDAPVTENARGEAA